MKFYSSTSSIPLSILKHFWKIIPKWAKTTFCKEPAPVMRIADTTVPLIDLCTFRF